MKQLYTVSATVSLANWRNRTSSAAVIWLNLPAAVERAVLQQMGGPAALTMTPCVSFRQACVGESGASALAPRGHNSGAFFSARRSGRSLFSSMQCPVDRLDGELFRIVVSIEPSKEFFVLRVTRIL